MVNKSRGNGPATGYGSERGAAAGVRGEGSPWATFSAAQPVPRVEGQLATGGIARLLPGVWSRSPGAAVYPAAPESRAALPLPVAPGWGRGRGCQCFTAVAESGSQRRPPHLRWLPRLGSPFCTHMGTSTQGNGGTPVFSCQSGERQGGRQLHAASWTSDTGARRWRRESRCSWFGAEVCIWVSCL